MNSIKWRNKINVFVPVLVINSIHKISTRDWSKQFIVENTLSYHFWYTRVICTTILQLCAKIAYSTVLYWSDLLFSHAYSRIIVWKYRLVSSNYTICLFPSSFWDIDSTKHPNGREVLNLGSNFDRISVDIKDVLRRYLMHQSEENKTAVLHRAIFETKYFDKFLVILHVCIYISWIYSWLDLALQNN